MSLALLLAFLIAGHYLADFAMQTEYVALHKGDGWSSEHGVHTLLAHSMHHATMAGIASYVAGVDQWWGVSLAVGVSHAVIDYGKAGKGWFGVHWDQILHLAVILLVALVATMLGTTWWA